jgi:hypothetical protein
MDLIKLERALSRHGFMVSRYLAPAGGLTLSHPALSGVVDVAITQLGDNKYRVSISAPMKKKATSLIAPIREVEGEGEDEGAHEMIVEQIVYLLKKHIQTIWKGLWAEITEQLNSAQYEKIMGGDRSYKASALRVMKVSKSKKIHSLCTDLIQAYDRYFESSLHNK